MQVIKCMYIYIYITVKVCINIQYWVQAYLMNIKLMR